MSHHSQIRAHIQTRTLEAESIIRDERRVSAFAYQEDFFDKFLPENDILIDEILGHHGLHIAVTSSTSTKKDAQILDNKQTDILAYMSAELASAQCCAYYINEAFPNVAQHKVLHDLESSLWNLCWIRICRKGPGSHRLLTPNDIKSSHMRSNRVNIAQVAVRGSLRFIHSLSLYWPACLELTAALDHRSIFRYPTDTFYSSSKKLFSPSGMESNDVPAGGSAPAMNAIDRDSKRRKSSCGCSSDEGRNLVVCIDGTSNQFGPKNTNVIELYSRLVKNEKQLTYYNSGIGTYAKPSWKSFSYWKQIMDNTIDLAIAWNFEKIVMSAYRWLSDNYQDGDRIFLFGFSRGAYQVRTLAAMIHKVGLIHKGNEDQIPFAYELYADPKSDDPATLASPSGEGSQFNAAAMRIMVSNKPRTRVYPSVSVASSLTSLSESETLPPLSDVPRGMASRFKGTFSRPNVKVHFVGAWDTVSSVGIVRGKNLPGTVSGLRHICIFRHALALDERRVKFLPEYASGGVMLPEDEIRNASSNPTSRSLSNIKEVWFIGTHSDIGGGNVFNPDLKRSGPPLLWMSQEAKLAGIEMELSSFKWDWKKLGDVNESLSGVWWLLEYAPIKQLTFKDADAARYRFHRGRGRRIHSGQKIHATVALFSPEKYKPKAILPPEAADGDWHKLITSPQSGSYAHTLDKGLDRWKFWFEMDVSDMVEAVIRDFGDLTSIFVTVDRLDRLIQSAEGARAVRNVLDQNVDAFSALMNLAMRTNDPDPRLQDIITLALTKIAACGPRFSNDLLAAVLLSKLLSTDIQERDAAKFLLTQLSGANPMCKSLVNLSNFPCLAFYLACKSKVKRFSMDAAKEALRKGPFQYRLGTLKCLLFDLLADQDLDVQRLSTEVIASLGAKFSIVNDLARLSRDGLGDPDLDIQRRCIKAIVVLASSYREDVRDAMFQVHLHRDLHHLSFPDNSPDDNLRRLAITELKRRWPLHIAKEFRDNPVYSIAFSPDGKLIASGSWDKAVRVWAAETGEITAALTGHNDDVFSVAFSPDGKRIVSGSRDHTVRVWDAKTGHATSRPFSGHDYIVHSAAFSPDGKSVASGSFDKTIRLWDAETGEVKSSPFTVQSEVHSIAFSPDGKSIASGSWDKLVRVWNIKTGEAEVVGAHAREVTSVAFSPDGKYIASGSVDATVRVWNTETGEPKYAPLIGHTERVNAVAYSPDGSYIVSGSDDHTVQAWDAETGVPVAESSTTHMDRVTSVAFSPDGKYIASSSWDHTVKVWKAASNAGI
ncbi:hypothetical protein EW146_g3118 [Bondarzewia mesenterica]|uniref:T6SS Phospholipase effector Tle1-like catalytic domain-containing protein n=1 Tax=Bondarzewia mesenterica TaxID=1095465 RepID=A0A4S4M0U5_9AGAM|nr:hypothetical protein EW146_g3118 [Bondarzewia mesenterica]